MSHSLFTFIRVPAVAVGLVVLTFALRAGQSSVTASGARRAVPATKAWVPPRAADGHPDLQGTWDFATLTPLERPAEFAGKPTLTKEEAAAYEKLAIQRNDVDRREGTSSATDVARGYNNFWWDRGNALAEVNGAKLTSLIVDPPDGKVPPLTRAAQLLAAARAQARSEHSTDGPEGRSLSERCLLFNAGPPMLPGPYNNNVQLFQARDYVAILNEMIHDVRLVALDGRPHRPSTVRLLLGDSLGRWEGDTLVVDTTNFTDKTAFRGADENLHLIERFTLVSPDTLLYEFTVDDPTAFTRPWRAMMAMHKTDGRIFEYACHEANYAMTGILRGARAEEKGR